MHVRVTPLVPANRWVPQRLSRRARRKAQVVARRRGLPPPRFGHYERVVYTVDDVLYMHPTTYAALQQASRCP